MTYKQFLVDELHLNPKVLSDYIDPYFGAASFGVSGDVVSAYGAFRLQMPGTGALVSAEKRKAYKDREFASFPGGNTVMLRHLVKVAVPGAIGGGDSFSDIAYGPIDFDALDKPDNPVRIRLSSTVVRVEHDGPPDDAKKVIITYTRNGKLYRLTARAVVMAVGAYTSRNVLPDAPADMQAAFGEFHHAPMLLVNVALRHWRFMDRLGISAARWFQGFGWSTGIRRPMIVDGESQPLDPSKPILLSLYVPFVNYSGQSIEEQTMQARMELFSKTYRDYELEVRRQLTRLFGDHGLDPQRDIAGIVLNRWGHAYVSPQPGFYFGRNGNPAPGEIVARGYGRARFGHGEVTGFQSWSNCISQGRRATGEALEVLSA
jgi:spermidine dehydrogenase